MATAKVLHEKTNKTERTLAIDRTEEIDGSRDVKNLIYQKAQVCFEQ